MGPGFRPDDEGNLTTPAAENTNGHQPAGSALLRADKLGNTRNRARVDGSIHLGAQLGHRLN